MILYGHIFLNDRAETVLSFLVGASIVLFLTMLFAYDRLSSYLPFLKRIISKSGPASTHSKLKVLSYSLLRYLTYLIQYVLIIYALDSSLSLELVIGGACFIFLIQSVVFLPPALNFLARGEISIIVWTTLGLSVYTALMATIILWVINLALPAFMGMILLVNKKTHC